MQREVIVGTLLGNACIPLDRGKPTLRVQFEQNIARANYIWHLYSVFYDFVGTPPRVKKIRGGGDGFRDRQSIHFKTFGHPDFKFYDKIFYTVETAEGASLGRKKKVPENIH